MSRKITAVITVALMIGLFTSNSYATTKQTIKGTSVYSKYTGASWNLSQTAQTSPLSYSSGNTSVVTVTSDGKATAKKAGDAVITVTAPADSVYSKAVKYITVYVKNMQSISGPSSYEKKVGETWNLGQSAKTTPLSYSSGNSSVVSVSTDGIATAKSVGKTTVRATAPSGGNYGRATKDIAVTVKPKEAVKQTITGASSVSLKQGKSMGLNQKAKTSLTYSSSNTYVASVSSKGVIKGKHGGTAIITVKAKKTTEYLAATRKITVKVKPKAYSSLTAIKNITSDDVTVFSNVRGINSDVHVPQALAYRGGNDISVCFTNESYSRQAIKNFEKSTCKKAQAYNCLAHANGMTYKKGNLYVTDNHSSNRTKGYVFNASSLKKSGTYKVEKKTGGIAYDSVNGHTYRSIGYSLKDSTTGKKFHKKPYPKWPQDIGGKNGYIYNCVSLNKNGNNRIDIYSRTGGYYGSYTIRFTHSELESVAVDNTGHLLILINYRIYRNSKTIDKVYRTKETLAF